jgi:hypothetical protein
LIYNALNYNATQNDFIIPFTVTGIDFGLIAAQLNNIILSSVKITQTGVASGINGTLREVARALGVAIIGAAFISTVSTAVVNNINAQSDQNIPNAVKQNITNQFSSGDNQLGRDTPELSDEEILQQAQIPEQQRNISQVRARVIANYRTTQANVKEQINRGITEASRTSMQYTVGANVIAIILAFGIKNKIKSEK